MRIPADVACASIEEVERELRELADSDHSLVVHLTWGQAFADCSENHEHIVMEVPWELGIQPDKFPVSPAKIIVEAIIAEHERLLLTEMQEPMASPGMNSRDERVRNLATRIAGVQVRVRQWAEVSNFNGGYDIGGTDYELLVN